MKAATQSIMSILQYSKNIMQAISSSTIGSTSGANSEYNKSSTNSGGKESSNQSVTKLNIINEDDALA